MDTFDRYSDNYRDIVQRDVRLFGESTDYFFLLKIGLMRECLAEHLPASRRPLLRILEIGCGVGGLLPFLPGLERPFRAFALDLSFSSVAQAARRTGSTQGFLNADATRLPLSNASMDVVCFAGVMHHLRPDAREPVLKEVGRILQPGGLAMIFEHNPYNPLTRWVVSRSPLDRDASLVSLPALSRQVRDSGLELVRRQYTTFFPKPLSRLRFLEPKLSWCGIGAQYFLGARKRPA